MALNLFNMSKLLYPNILHSNNKFYLIITVKECILKLIQIILKLIIATKSLTEDCRYNNTSILMIMIGANLLSII